MRAGRSSWTSELVLRRMTMQNAIILLAVLRGLLSPQVASAEVTRWRFGGEGGLNRGDWAGVNIMMDVDASPGSIQPFELDPDENLLTRPGPWALARAQGTPVATRHAPHLAADRTRAPDPRLGPPPGPGRGSVNWLCSQGLQSLVHVLGVLHHRSGGGRSGGTVSLPAQGGGR